MKRRKAIVRESVDYDSGYEGRQKAWRCSHRVVFRVVAELLGDGGVAKEKCEVGEHVLTRWRNSTRCGELTGTGVVLLLHCFNRLLLSAYCASLVRNLWLT